MIELIVEDRCTACNKCVQVCPTDVLDFGAEGGRPVIARQEDCTSCMNCELYCPHDAIWVSPLTRPDPVTNVEQLVASGELGRYRRAMNWENGRAPQGTGDNWGLQLSEAQGEKPPPAHDKIRQMLYAVRDRNLITPDAA